MTELILTSEYANVLMLLNGLAILFYIAAKKKNKQRAMKFGNYETLQKIAGRKFLKSSNVVLLIRLLALTALIVGISNPVLVEEKPASSSDYVLAIDSSASMLATDLEPSRLEAAKSLSSDFVGKLSEDTRIGIVSFSGSVRNELTLTEQATNVSDTIENIEVGDEGGTAIGGALTASASMLIGSNRSKTIVLITDGRNNVGVSINESIKFVKNRKASVYTIGIGSQRNESEEREEFRIIQGQNASRAEFPNLNTGSLFRIANETGGDFKAVTDTSGLEESLVEIQQERVETDISIYFIFAAMILLILEWLLGTTRYSVIP